MDHIFTIRRDAMLMVTGGAQYPRALQEFEAEFFLYYKPLEVLEGYKSPSKHCYPLIKRSTKWFSLAKP